METIINSAQEVLVDSLSFKLPITGKYITERRFSTFHTEGSNSYSSSQGTKVIRFRLAGDSWLDPSTLRFCFDVVNNDADPGAKKLRPIGRAHAFFKRFRVSVRGQIIEDINDFNRVSELFQILQPKEAAQNDSAEGFGYPLPIKDMNTTALLPGITTSQTVMFKPVVSGIFSQPKFLPLRYAPIEIELELADASEPIITPQAATFTAANTTDKWKLENCMIKVDLCTLDSALENSYVKHLSSGKSINVVYDTYISSLQTVVSSDSQVNVSRSLTKLKSLFLSLDKDFTATTGRDNFYMKQFNNFWSPNAGNTVPTVLDVSAGERFSHLQLQISSRLYPEYPIKSSAESFYNLKKALGLHTNKHGSIDVNGVDYRSDKFIVGFDTEKSLGLAFTGTNTKNSLMTVHLKTQAGDYKADRMHVVLMSEQILEIRDTGVDVHD